MPEVSEKLNKAFNFRKICLMVIAILVVFWFLCFLQVSAVQAAGIYLSPHSGTYRVGDNFSVGVYVNSPDQAVNACSGTLSFPNDKMEVTSLSKAGSFINFWVSEPSFSNTDGIVKFEGVAISSNIYKGQAGKIITINFKVKAVGSPNLSFVSGSVLANDGKGTNVLASMQGANYNFNAKTTIPAPSERIDEAEVFVETPVAGAPSAPVIYSTTHPDPDKWYNNDSPELSWQLASDITAVRLLIGKLPTATPSILYSPPVSEKKIEDLTDGTWYFHVRFRNSSGWGDITHRKILIDTEAPKSFGVIVDNGGDSTNPSPDLYFETSDSLSGIDYYEVKVGNLDSYIVPAVDVVGNRPYKIPALESGQYKISIKAFDKAGNFSSVATDITVKPLGPPKITECPSEVKAGEDFIVKGISPYISGKVSLIIEKDGREIVREGINVDEKGNWSFINREELGEGICYVWAEAIDKRGAKSSPTEKIPVKVSAFSLLKSCKTVIDYLSIALLIIALVIALALLVYFTYHKIILWRKKRKKETDVINKNKEKALNILLKEVLKQLGTLNEKPALSKSEFKMLKSLEKTVNKIKKLMSDDLEDL